MKVATAVWMDELLETLDRPHKYEGYLVSCCPFHDDLHPSFFVYPDHYNCLSCGAHGDTSKLLARLGKVKRAPSPYYQGSHTEVNPFTRWMKHSTLTQTLRAAWRTINDNPGMGYYITRDRKIIEPYRRKLGIGYIDDWYTIPITDRYGTIISAVARAGRDSSSSKYVLPNGTNPRTLYIPHWPTVRKATYLIITFGILDAITLSMMNFPVASYLTGTKLNYHALESFRIPILVIPDHKEEEPAMRLVGQLGWRGQLVRLPWPDGCKDINDIWMKDQQLCRSIMQDVKPKH